METEEELNARMRGIMNSDKVVLFMKGRPDAPRCGFSRQTVEILRKHEVAFTHFDILQDEAVRQGESGCLAVAVETDLGVLIGMGIGRAEEAQQLADISSVDHRRRVGWWAGHSPRDGGEWRVPGGIGECRRKVRKAGVCKITETF